jgi:hypothetical protein
VMLHLFCSPLPLGDLSFQTLLVTFHWGTLTTLFIKSDLGKLGIGLSTTILLF